jgi:hypothetical protein
MARFKVLSGEYETVVTEETCRKAADLAIQRHNNSKNACKLGELTLVEKLDGMNQPDGEASFICTKLLIENNTAGFGDKKGQYTREDC